MEEVYILYVGDCWLSTNSLNMIGVFTDESNLEKGVKEAIRFYERDFREEDEEDDGEEAETIEEVQNRVYNEFLLNRYQTQGYDVNLLAEKVKTNQFNN